MKIAASYVSFNTIKGFKEVGSDSKKARTDLFKNTKVPSSPTGSVASLNGRVSPYSSSGSSSDSEGPTSPTADLAQAVNNLIENHF